MLTRLRAAWVEFWDRLSASDPGLLRLQNALTVAGGVLLALGVLAALQQPVPTLVVGGLLAMVASFAVSDPRPAAQATTLAGGVLVAGGAIAVGTALYPHRAAADAVFIVLVFTAVYIRRFGPRGTGLGLIAFQSYFVSQFAHATLAQVPRLLGVTVLAFACSAVVRFGLVRNTPERTLGRLERAFAVRWSAVVEAVADLAEAPAGLADAKRTLRRRATRLHQCALMIHARLETAVPDPRYAALLEIRVAGAEVAADRLGRVLTRALGGESFDGPLPARPDPDPARLAPYLRALAEPVLTTGEPPDTPALEKLLAYREDGHLPPGDAAPRDVYRAAGDLAGATLGLSAVLHDERPAPATRDDHGHRHGRGAPVTAAPAPPAPPAAVPKESEETTLAREELDTENEVRALSAAQSGTPGQAAGLRRRTTRLASQVAAGSALAIIGGELLSAQRWYWAVLTCWVVFINTTSTGEVLIKGYRRVVGTIAGVLAGGLIAAQLAPHPWAAFVLAIACVFGMFFTAPVSYSLMSFFVTTMIGLLYTLLGTFSENVLVLRIEETALGAACGFLAATVVLPVRIGRHTNEQLSTVLDRLGSSVVASAARIGGPPQDEEDDFDAQPLRAAREMDAALDALRSAMEPVIHPANPLRPRRQRALYLARVLDGCAYHARALAALAQSSYRRPCVDAATAQLVGQAAARVGRNAVALSALIASGGERPKAPWEPERGETVPEGTEPGSAGTATQALRHLHRIDEGLGSLARILGVAARED